MRKLLITLIVATMAVAASGALLPDAKFRRLDTRDGLSNSQVNCVFRDSRGFVWIGTSYGLNRYDGYRFKSFYTNPRDTTTIRDNSVTEIFESYDGKLWLHLGMNYCIYDPLTETFERNLGTVLSKFGINGGVEYLYIDSHKNFWVKLYDDGIFYYNPYSRRLHKFPLGYGPQELRPDYGISSFADLGSSVVMTTFNGEMVCFNGEKGHISWKNTWMKRHGGVPSQEYHLIIDRKGNLYVRNLNNLFVFLQKTKRWYKSLPEMLRAYGVENVPNELMVWDVMTDRKGLLWVATDHTGLFVINLRTRELRQFLYDKFDSSTLSDNTPRNVYEDRDGQIWIGTYKNGANQYRAGSTYARSVELGDVNTVVEDRYGHFWVGTNDRGIIVYDANTDEQLQHYTAENSGLSGNIMVGSTYASDGSIWFGSYNGGLVRCIPTGDKRAGQAVIVNYVATGQPETLANNSVWSVIEDKWHRIWMGLLGGGIQMLDLKTGKFRTWDTSNTELTSNYLTSASWTKKGWLMMGTSYYYSLVNPVKGKLINLVFPGVENLSNNTGNTVCVMEDSRGLVWQGSVSGVCVYDPTTQRLQTLDMTNGLYGSSVCSITEDLSHVMWVVTDHGVSRIIPQKGNNGLWQFTIRSFNHRDGLQQGTYNQRSARLTRDGRLLIGGQGGLDIITPERIGSSTSDEQPLLSGLLIDDREVEVGHKVDGHVVLHKALSKSDNLKLRNSENNFTIQLGSTAGLACNDKRFVYMLEGFRDTWNKTAENNPNIAFMSLHPGNYNLRVRMLNDDGTMGEKEVALGIHISQSLWLTRWAILLYLALLTAFGWWWRRRFLRRQADHLRLEQLRRETEKTQWMHEMQARWEREHKGMTPSAPAEETQEPLENPDHLENLESPAASSASSVAADNLVTEKADLIAFARNFCDTYQIPADKQVRLSFLALVPELTVAFDKAQLGYALRILIDNAVNFSPSEGRVKMLIDRVGYEAELRVADNGLGIPEEAKPYMFAPPAANDDTIGLYRVKDIVEAHGGSVRVTDNNPTGTVFYIMLPLDKNDDIPVEDAVMMD